MKNRRFFWSGASLILALTIENRVKPDVIAALRAMGHTVEILPGWGSLGHMQTIRIDQQTGAMTAGGDPRRTGYAMGY
jgi:gamma-glutamyltranspeptidase